MWCVIPHTPLGLITSFRDERPLTCTCSKECMSNRRLDRSQSQTPMNMPCNSAASLVEMFLSHWYGSSTDPPWHSSSEGAAQMD